MILSYIYFLLSPHCTGHECYAGIGGLIILGLSCTLYGTVLWPSIALIVDPNILGAAYGLATSVQNVGLALAPLIVGVLIDNKAQTTGDGKMH